MSRLCITAKPDGSRTVVRPRGDIDMATAGALRDSLDLVIRRSPVPHVELDMSDAPFMDCAGLRVLLPMKRRAERRGGSLTLVNVPSQIDRLLSAVGLDHRLEANGRRRVPVPRPSSS
ncbi:STAS domain-containing protein [Microtetraspora niveoalba]|uniref:STAS domain-containing protein n=1 Tax=Microtetraspora niveoalba TaxID=46175 RepID=UPI00082C7369|nr:STAS domain-containing protein [Microtetraspora niveoalba]